MTLFAHLVELMFTQDSGYFAKVSNVLRGAGIAYKVKIQNIGHSNRRGGLIGAIGENTNYSNMYQIFVKKTDVEYAKALITKEYHQSLS